AYQLQAPLERLGVAVGFLRAEASAAPQRQLRFLAALAREARRHDAVIYQKMLHPLRIRYAARHNPNLFYDFDDALYLTSSERKFARTIRAAPRIIAGNGLLAERARRYQREVDVVPTTVVVPSEVEPASHQGPLRLSWMGSACNLHYLEPVRSALRSLRTRGLDLRLHILTEQPELAGAEPGVLVERWSFAAEERAMKEAEIGLMPLVDDEWSRGKCACKALQYLSQGRPVIASPVGVNRTLLEGRPYALLPESSADWEAAIASLAARRSELDGLGREGHSMVRASYSVDVWAQRLRTILSRPLSPSCPPSP
ncbi:MAG TPA: glycosyltransferase, partial [Polyangiaceae bacterium]|nr:glycosyltransferase [Polyangiaceae bacterium]